MLLFSDILINTIRLKKTFIIHVHVSIETLCIYCNGHDFHFLSFSSFFILLEMPYLEATYEKCQLEGLSINIASAYIRYVSFHQQTYHMELNDRFILLSQRKHKSCQP